jgi:shikimate 5-dehydrogenase
LLKKARKRKKRKKKAVALAKEAGCETINGLEMFLLQGTEQFRLWTGKQAPIEKMRSVIEKELKK